MSTTEPNDVLARYRRALESRANWENHWQECYEFALPQRGPILHRGRPGEKRTERLFDGTAPDAVDQLASVLMAHLTPAAGRWFTLRPGPDVSDYELPAMAGELDRITTIAHAHFERSNFAVEAHQCFLDLITAGTACLLFEEAGFGQLSAFQFTAVPLNQVALEDGGTGRLDTTFRRNALTVAQLQGRFPDAPLSDDLIRRAKSDPTARATVVEAIYPEGAGYAYRAVLDGDDPTSAAALLAEGRFAASPFINFRWLRAPGEVYGRSPVMKALPDIKTANKVVELVLKNASIAVTGIWQADDDGVLNPANIQLIPGTIIPKAVGSAGLTPLEAPGRFDISELVLEQLRERIRKSLFVDQLGQVAGPRMTATEVLERSAEMARVLSAVFARLQSEFLTPLIQRALALLARRGEIPPVAIDGRDVVLELQTPHSRYRAQQDAQNTLLWLGAIKDLGPDAAAIVDPGAAARWLARAFGVPGEILREPVLTVDVETAAGALLDALAPGLAAQEPPGHVGTPLLGGDPGEMIKGATTNEQ